MNPDTGKHRGEDFNVRRVHGQILREKDEPHELYQRIPWWLKHCIYAPLTIWAIWYFLYASGGFRWDSYSERFGDWRIDAKALVQLKEVRTAAPPARDPMETGRTVYTQVCAACHQPDGGGLAGAFPPLAASDWVAGDDRRLALLTLHGLTGPITVNGEPWSGVMPAQGVPLDDSQIADVLTYIRASWGNDAPPVDESTVAELREKFPDHPAWTIETLDAALANP
jgi:mono/diheme cytochrome c family protein